MSNKGKFSSGLKKLKKAADIVKDKVDDIGLSDAKDALQSTAGIVRSKVKDIDLDEAKDKIQDAAKSVKDKLDDIDLDDAKDKLQDTAAAVKSKVDDIDLENVKGKVHGAADSVKGLFDSDEDDLEDDLPETEKIRMITPDNAMKVFYYLMTVNGNAIQDEMDKFEEIGKELDARFDEHKTGVIDSCKKQMDKMIDPEDHYAVIQEGVDDAIMSQENIADNVISAKLVVWDMLVIAFADDHYDELERKLIKHVVRKLDIDKAELLEMESSYLTLKDLEKEEEWIKSTDKQYRIVEAALNEIADRKSVVLESVRNLILL